MVKVVNVVPEQSKQRHDELDKLYQWLEEGRAVALVTVIATWGSSPRPVGSHMLVDDQMHFLGSVSGGCIEAAVITEALMVIEQQAAKKLSFSVSNQDAWQVGLSCGGAIEVYIQPVTATLIVLLQSLHSLRQKKQEAAIIIDTRNNTPQLWHADLVSPVVDQHTIEQLIRTQRSALVGEHYFVRTYVADYRLAIIGAVHIAQSLAPMAATAGFDVTIIDPRRAFACAERFPGSCLNHQWPDEALDDFSLDAQSAIVTLTHDPKLDDPALIAALNSSAFYIGCLGSQRTHRLRLERMAEHGLGAQSHRLHGPVGIKLGGRAPAEIAVSILAQLIQVRYQVNQQREEHR